MRAIASTLCALFLIASLPALGAIPQTERDALISLFNSTNGPNWKDNTGWGGAAGTECTWFGVSCDSAQAHVSDVIVPDNGLTGTIPLQISGLSELRVLYLYNNDVGGAVPASIGSLTRLVGLALEGNELTGALPPEMGNLASLEYVNVGGNKLAGVVPDSIWNLSKLQVLYLYRNNFEGQIPARVGDLADMVGIALEGNRFDGSIPPEIGRLRKLTFLNVSENQLSGTLPESLGDLTSLKSLYAEFNEFSGPIPTSLSRLSNLEAMSFFSNQLSGPIPPELGNLSKLKVLTLSLNELTGTIPASLGNLTNLEIISVGRNHLTGEVPDSIWSLRKIQVLYLYANELEGQVPSKLGDMVDMVGVALEGNKFSGPLPDVYDRMPNLVYFNVGGNDLTGIFPSTILQARKLRGLLLYANLLSGPIPSGLGDLAELDNLALGGNQFSGTIPSELGNLTKLKFLWLGGNLLTGAVPESLGNLTALEWLALYGNDLRGEVPRSLLNLIATPSIDLSDNALRASGADLAAFLDARGTFTARQTVPPANVNVDSVTSYTATLSWSPIAYATESGGYQVLASTSPGGPYSPLVTTKSKEVSTARVTGLSASTRYYFVIQSVTYPHGGSPFYQLNTVFSDPSAQVTAMTLPPSSTPASVIVTAFPAGLVQTPDVGGATDSYTLTNIGGTATTITLGGGGSFFIQEPQSFTLAPGASQIVVLTGRPQPAGMYDDTSIPTGTGVPAGLSIPVTLVCAVPPSNSFLINAAQNRLDLIAPVGVDPSGNLVFRNDGTGAFAGVVSSDVQFLVPQRGLITIPPGGAVSVSVTSIRAKRPDSDSLSGTQAGNVTLVPIPGIVSGKSPLGGTSVSLVSVVDTVKPQTGAAAVPPLAPNEVALYLASVGHVVGSVGEFLSDLSILNAYGTSSIPDLKLYYTALGSSSSSVANLSTLGTSQAVALADVVKSVFGGSAEVGTIQIRSTRATNLSVNASIFNSSNPKGNYGTSIPVLRSDRSIVAGQSAFLTGLRKDASGHANFYVQETRGKSATVSLDFLAADGTIIGAASAAVAPFGLTRLVDPLSLGTVAVRLNVTGGEGAVAAYATPVDRESGDTWAVADWALQYGYSQSEPIVIPIGGAVRGANGTYFRTDVSITNRCATLVDVQANPDLLRTTPCRGSSSTGRLRYYPTSGGVVERELDLGLLQTSVMSDVVRSVFGIETDTVGHLVFLPSTGAFAATSRTYTIVEGSPATFGSTVPALGSSLSLRRGQSRRIGALQDTTKVTIGKRTPATNRTNFGIVETSGEDVTVQVTVYLNDPRSLAAGQPAGQKTYQLRPRELVNLSGLLSTILGEARETRYADLNDVQVQFDVVSPTGAILVYTSSVDNGTGDSLLRTE